MNNAPVTVLTSAVGLGVYIPALLIERRLARAGLAAELQVLESFYTPERQLSHLAHKKAHHESFALAQIAHRMAHDVSASLDGERVDALLEGWARQGRTRFIVWSGFWLPVIERYRALHGAALQVDHCRIDAEISASFKVHSDLRGRGKEIWLWDWSRKQLVHEIAVTGSAPIPFADRERRLLVHGGGWGIGTYRDKAIELAASGHALDVVIHDPAEARDVRGADRCHMMDPAWRPWQRNGMGGHDFPPMGEVVDRENIEYRSHPDHHILHDIVRRSRAIVSKPGGCTLIDSLAAATPVVLLEPYGYAEAANARIWEHLGFGIPYAAWRARGYDPALLEGLHANLLARQPCAEYPGAYAEEVLELTS